MKKEMIQYWYEQAGILYKYPKETNFSKVIDDFKNDEQRKKIFYISYSDNDLEKMFF